jgi:conjugal transfer mating pair stabilization protein TraG
MALEYWTFGNADVVLQLLNAVAAITANDSAFIGLVKASALLGFLVVVVGAVLKADPRGTATWFIALLLGWYVLFVPRVEMVIVDNSEAGTSSRTVGNVPLGLGFIASAGSKVGRYLTQTAETVFSLPERASFINGGLLAPHRVSLATLNFTMPNTTLAADWMNYLRDCTWYDMYVYSRKYGYTWAISPEELENSADPLASLGKTNNVLFVHTNTGGSATRVCRDAYEILRFATVSEAESTPVQRRYAMKAFPGKPEAEAIEAFQQAVADAQSLLYAAPIATHQLITNRWVHNLLRMQGTRNAIADGNTALAMVEFGAVQAEQARLNAYLQSARAAQDTVPSMRNILEAVTIGLFPVVLIVMVLTGLQGMRAFMEWALVFLSLQLWGFCYALMNFFLISKTAANVYALVNSNSAGDVSLATMSEVAEEITADMAMAGTMVWAIPVICYGLTKGVSMGMMSMASSMAATSRSSAESTGSQVGTGNVRSGEGRFATSSASNSISVGGEAGTSMFYTGGNGNIANAPRVSYSGYSSSAPVSLSTALTNSATLSATATAMAQASEQMSTKASEMKQAAVADTVSTALKSSNMTALDKQWQSQGMGSFKQGAGATQKLVDTIGQTFGASQQEATNLLMGAGLGTPMLSPVTLNTALNKQYGSDASVKFDAAMKGEGAKTAQKANEWAQTFTNSETARHSVMGGRENSKGVDARLQQAAALEKASTSAWTESQSLQKQAQAVASGQASLGIDLAKVSPQLAEQISAIAQQPEFQRAINSGNVQGATDILAHSLAARFSDGQGGIGQVLDLIAQKPTQAPALANGTGLATTRDSLKQSHNASAARITKKGEDGVNAQWEKAPTVSVGGPDISGQVQTVTSGQAQAQAAVKADTQKVLAEKAALAGKVTPEVPGMRAGGLTQPNSQVVDLSVMFGNSVANAGNGVLGFGAQAASELLGSAPVQGAAAAAQGAAANAEGVVGAVTRGAMQAPSTVANFKGGPPVTFPYDGRAEGAPKGNMDYVNKLRAEKGLPPFPSDVDQIPSLS